MDTSRLTERDKKVWEYIAKTRYVTTSQLAQLFFWYDENGKRNKYALDICRRRLKYMEENLPITSFYRGARSEKVYCLKKPGKEVMLTPGALDHSIELNDIMIKIKHHADRNKHNIVDFRIEPVLLNKVMPDILLIYEINKRIKIFFIEYDKGTMTLNRIRKKLLQYKEYFAKKLYLEEDWQPGDIKPSIVYLCESEARAQNIRQLGSVDVVTDITKILW
ncbi:replication-relaxation family protein [Caldicoprobacter algeriensis]|uniref:replication-relaxation family protein n=1 Tax=Caldicoprobacter algeriensis TaxID=699281 RepID=UPI00207AE22F|nr:replication-relaxation family protein [Caldicoprobacter algeriensis]MCM8900636.1 replication-relaxation family protein [Caldicoprobacter algeriensis]